MKLDRAIKEIEADVLVIGGGMAATMAAIEAKRHNLEVALVDKGRLGFSGTSPRCGGGGNDWVMVPPEVGGDPRDSLEVQLQDCVKGGDYLNDQEMTELYNSETLTRMMEMESFGVRYSRNPDGTYDCRRLMNCTYPRGVGSAQGGSLTMMRTMKEQVFKRGISVYENIMLTKLLIDEGRVVGAFGLDCRTGEFFAFKAKAAILAAGSATDLYKYPTCENVLTGDAYALAYNAGVPLMNMEFLQFSITSKIDGIHIKGGLGIKPMITAGVAWVNASGERIMDKNFPQEKELAGWWKHVYAIHKENKDGNGPVYMDLSRLSEEDQEGLFEDSHKIFNLIKRLGLDVHTQKVELIPGLHTFLGGARVNTRAETSLPGLYAAGESAGQGGIFGADRTGGGIAAGQVVGHRAGKYAAEFSQQVARAASVKTQAKEEADRIISLLRDKGDSPYDIVTQIKDIALESLGISRNGKGLAKAVEQLSNLRKQGLGAMKTENTWGLVKALEAQHLALTGEMVARAGQMRAESRGQHRREDYPERNDRDWLKWIIISKKDEQMSMNATPVPIKKYKVRPPGLV